MVYNEATAARAVRSLEFAILCNKILEYRRRIPKSAIRKIQDYKLPFTAATEDKYLGKIFKYDLIMLDYVIKYAEAFNAGDKEAAAEFRQKAIAAHEEGDRLRNEVLDRGL